VKRKGKRLKSSFKFSIFNFQETLNTVEKTPYAMEKMPLLIKKMRLFLIIIIGKVISAFNRFLNLGAGGTWPGEIALWFDKDIFSKLTKDVEEKIILIAGTNGKTTTAKMTEEILRDGDIKTLRNESGGNVLNGLVSTLVVNGTFSGKINADWVIFEVDEATLPIVLNYITPKTVVLLNLFRDQLDRYGEVDILAEKWLSAFKKLPKETTIILNADDPQIAYLGKNLKLNILYFGLKNQDFFLKKIPHATDSLYCPSCSTKLNYAGVFISHLGDWWCEKCGLKKPELAINENRWDFPLEGVYNRYNTLAAILVGKSLGIPNPVIKGALKNFKPAFGRQEEFEIKGRRIKIYLSKNPTGMNEAIRTITKNLEPRTKNKQIVLLVLNDRIPDGRDVSWIWDVDTEELQSSFNQIIVSGDRAYDMGLRIKYSDKLKTQNSKLKTTVQNSKLIIEENLKRAIYLGIEKTPINETFYILPTYSAMLEVRKILTGRKIL